MPTIGSWFALGITILICTVFFRNRYFLTRASRYYIVCLILTLVSTASHIATMYLYESANAPIWSLCAAETINQILLILTTSILYLYLIVKVVEHIYNDNIVFAKVFLTSIFAIFLILSVINLFTGIMFTVDEQGTLQKGPFHYAIYIVSAIQLIPVCYKFIRHRKYLDKTIKFASVESAIMVIFCVILKILQPNLSIFLLAISLIELTFFLNFLNQRTGVNTLTKLNDSRRFMTELTKRIRLSEPFKAYLIKIKNLGYIKQHKSYRDGDELLYLFGFSLDKLFSEAISFHLHGTTFALILPCDKNESPEQTDKLKELLDTKIAYKDTEIKLEYIIVENVWDGESSADSFYEKLEYGAEVAKSLNLEYIKYSLELEAARLRKKYLIDRLHTIDKESGYEIWFQPIYSTKKSAFTSVEVLLRLKEKNGSFISPAEFIPIAEKTGQIVDITWFVIEETCRALSTTPELDGMRASINMPMGMLVDETFEQKLNKIVDGYGVDHERISLEFTERVILDDLALAEKNMKNLAKSGYTFYLDDFGVGYSNFNCVLRLPLKTIKLDASLTATTDQNGANLVYILTDLFHDMGLNVISEGAETFEQVSTLKDYGVDGIQGYYFAKPMPIDALKNFITNNNA